MSVADYSDLYYSVILPSFHAIFIRKIFPSFRHTLGHFSRARNQCYSKDNISIYVCNPARYFVLAHYIQLCND